LKAKIPGIVQEMIDITKEQTTQRLTERKEYIVKAYNDKIEELLRDKENQLREIKEAKEKNDPGKKLALEEKKSHLLELQTECDKFVDYA